jgi:lysophospholipase L1-like esterase
LNRRKLVSLGIAVLLLALSVAVIWILESSETARLQGLTRVACLGDSITEVSGYPNDLQSLLAANYTVENFGVTGATVLLDTDRPYLNQTAFQQANAFQPNVVVIMLGTNDARTNIYQSIKNFVSDYTKLITQVQTFKSKPKIWLIIPPPIFTNNLSLNSTYLVDGVIPRIKTVASLEHLPLIDVYSALTAYPTYFPDGVHPNSEGAEIIASTIAMEISQ